MKYLGLSVLLVAVEAALGTQLRIGRVVPDLVLLGVIAYSRKDLSMALYIGFIGGFLQDLAYGSSFMGLNSLTKIIIGYISTIYFERFGIGYWANIFSIFLLSLGYGLTAGLLKYLFGYYLAAFPWMEQIMILASLNTLIMISWLIIWPILAGGAGLRFTESPSTLGSKTLS